MKYKVFITTLTPLHIGTGQDLLKAYDLQPDPQQRRTYRLNIDAILEHALAGDNPQLDHQLLNSEPAGLVTMEELRQRPEFSTYVLKGIPRSSQVKEQIKNVWGQLYLPGSSLKGALRTAIARSIANSETIKPKLRVNYKGNKANKEAADDEMDAVIFGRGANYDLMRAMQVADSQPAAQVSPILINVSVMRKGKAQAPIDLEAIPAQTTFETTFHLDEYLYQEQRLVTQQNGQWVRPIDKLGWSSEQTKWFRLLPIAARNLAQRRFKQEITYYQAAGLNRLAQIYEIWRSSLASLKETQTFYLQLGWAGGWENKTLGQALIAPDEQAFAKIRNDFGLGKPPNLKEAWSARAGDIFPASRRLRVNERGEPLEPLGWVEVRLEKS